MQTSQVTITIDTHSFIQNLMAAGFKKAQAQAEAVMEEIQKITLLNVATKSDIAEVKKEISDLRIEMSNLRYEILKWVVPLILGLYGLIIFKML